MSLLAATILIASLFAAAAFFRPLFRRRDATTQELSRVCARCHVRITAIVADDGGTTRVVVVDAAGEPPAGERESEIEDAISALLRERY